MKRKQWIRKKCSGCDKTIWPLQRNTGCVSPMHIKCWGIYNRGADDMRWIIMQCQSPFDFDDPRPYVQEIQFVTDVQKELIKERIE